MKSFFTCTTLILLFASCNQGYKYWDISKFNIVDSALKDGEEIKMLYHSQGPDDNRNQEYYFQIVAVSQKTGDTINILTSIYNGFTQSDGDKIYNYFDQNNIASKILALDYDKLSDTKEIAQAENIEQKKISKVARDPKFDNIADNKYPTVIGTIGTLTKPQ